jgi:hypothetical protein
MEFESDTVCKELRELVRAVDMVLEKTKGAPDSLTDFELRLLEHYTFRLHSGLASAKTAARRRKQTPHQTPEGARRGL